MALAPFEADRSRFIPPVDNSKIARRVQFIPVNEIVGLRRPEDVLDFADAKKYIQNRQYLPTVLLTEQLRQLDHLQPQEEEMLIPERELTGSVSDRGVDRQRLILHPLPRGT